VDGGCCYGMEGPFQLDPGLRKELMADIRRY
jgi:hypothetical protein